MIAIINDYLKKKISEETQIKNRKIIYDYLLKNTFSKPNFKILTSDNIHETFILFDNLYFNYSIENYINENKIKISFDASKKLIKTAGKVCIKKDYKSFKFLISSSVLGKIFDENIDRKKLGGIICYNRLECYIILFEHEFIHLIIGLSNLNKNETSHGPIFRKLIRNIFGQKEYSHNLLMKGDVLEIEKQIECLKKELKIGDLIETVKISNIIFKGKIIKINPKNVRIKMENGQILNVKYEIIDKVI